MASYIGQQPARQSIVSDDSINAAKIIDGTVTGADLATDITISTTGSITSGGLTVDTNTLYVDSSNNRVGIGTTSPGYPLHVVGSADGSQLEVLTLTNSAGTDGSEVAIRFINSTDIDNGPNATEISSIRNGTNDHDLVFSTSNGSVTERLRITSEGYVGIGTSSPTNTLSISDTTANLLSVIRANNSGAGQISLGNSDGYVRLGGDNGEFSISSSSNVVRRFTVDTSNQVGIGTASPQRALHISASVPIIRGTDTDTSSYGEVSFSSGSVDIRADEGNATASSYIVFRNDGSEIARFDSNGRFGIGTNTPSVELDVTGDGAFSGDVTITGDLTVDTNTLYVDSTNNEVGIGTTNPADKLHVKGGNFNSLFIDNDGSQYTSIKIGNNGTENQSDIYWDNTGTSLNVRNRQSGFLGLHTGDVLRMTINTTETVINDNSNDYDFRVESNNNTHALFVNGGNDRVGVGTSSPTAIFDTVSSDATIARFITSGNSGLIQVGSSASVAGSEARVHFLHNNLDGNRILSVSTEDFSTSANRSSYLKFQGRSNGNNYDMVSMIPGASGPSVGIGTNSPERALHIKDSNSVNFLLENDSDSSVGSKIDLYHNSASPSTADFLSIINTSGNNSVGTKTDFAAIEAWGTDYTDGSEDAALRMRVMKGGSLARLLFYTSGELSINDDSHDIDFRVESNNNSNMLFVNGNTDRVGIGTNAPASHLDIRTTSGTISDLNQTLTIEERSAWTQAIAIGVYNTSLYASSRPSAFLGTVNSTSSFILSGGARVTSNPDGGSWATAVGTTATFLRGVNGDFRVYTDSGLTADTAYTPTERLRLNSSGRFFVNTTGDINSERVGIRAGTNEQALGLKVSTNAYSLIQGWDSSNNIRFTLTGNGELTHYQGGAIFNQNGADSDFRVESNDNTHALFVDGGNNRVGIKTSSPSYDFHVTGTGLTYAGGDNALATFTAGSDMRHFVKIQNTHGNSGASASMAGFDIDVRNHNNSGVARSFMVLRQITSGGGGGDTNISVPKNIIFKVNNVSTVTSSTGEMASSSTIEGTEAMRIESDGKVGIGDTSPDALLSIKGNSDAGTTPTIRLKDGTDTREAFISNQSGDLILATASSSDNVIDSAITIYSSQIVFNTGGTTRLILDSSGHWVPDSTNTYDLGSSTKVWRNIYTSDFHMSNEGLDKGNDIDGTKGSWTFQEGEENLYLINNKNGKKYKFNLTEVA